MSQLNNDVFRQALGQFPTGVSIVTTDQRERSAAMTVSSFNSVSLDPPLILWSVKLDSPSFPVFRDAAHFCVNILAEDQHDLAHHFARPQRDKFAGVAYQSHASGCPVLANCAAHFLCRMWGQYDGGDHMIIVGEVMEAGIDEHVPLVFACRDFFSLAPRKASGSSA